MKIYYCDSCGGEIARRVLPGFNRYLFNYHTEYPIDGYHNGTVELHLHRQCLEDVKAGIRTVRPIEEIISLSSIIVDNKITETE